MSTDKVNLAEKLARFADHWHRRRAWEVIVEPDRERRLLVVVTAYPVWE